MAKVGRPTPPDKPQGNQLSDMAIRELLRAATPRAVERLVELVESKHPAVAMGASKVILAKVIPDLKAMEHSGKPGSTLPFTVIIQSNDKNRAE